MKVGTISQIEINDVMNHTIDFNKAWIRRYKNAAFYGNYYKKSCLTSKFTRDSDDKVQTWKLHLANQKRHISMIELVLNNKNKKYINKNKKELDNLIKTVYVNDMRDCDSNVTVNKTDLIIRINCLVQYDGDSIYEVWGQDKVKVIRIDFNTLDQLTICEIHLYANSFMPYHKCGSADIVLKSKMEFIKSSSKYGLSPFFRYICEDGFELIGNQDVRCGLNNYWLDEFPTCKPKITCPTLINNETVDVLHENVFSFDGNISAIEGSIATFQCKNQLKNDSYMIGDSVRYCLNDGNWTGIEPICISKSSFFNKKVKYH